jgi:hypothetical protein
MYMTDLVKYFKKLNRMQLVLALLMTVYILFPVPLPLDIASVIDTNLGSLGIVIFAIVLFLTVNPVLGVIAFITGYVLLHRAAVATGSEIVRKYLPNEDQKHQDMLQLHTLQQGKNLEEEAVSQIPPINPEGDIIGENPYKPVYSESNIEHTSL